MSKILFESTKFNWDAMLKITKIHLELIHILTCLCFLKKVQGVEFLMFLIGIANPTKSI